MTNLTLHRNTNSQAIAPPLPLPGPRSGAVSVRPATERDLVFIDQLQKKYSKAVAFASYAELLSHINEGTALIAVEGAVTNSQGRCVGGRQIGYCLYRDRYMKREDCGLVSQLVVDGEKQRGLVGAALVQAMFERVPWGVRLFCLWCAQDLDANHFWESLGFVPLAVRAGSRGKAEGGTRKNGTRVQIFWQRRVREGDDYAYWYPSQTTGGRMAEARLVLPIPPGKHWSDELPLVLPGIGLLGTKALPEGDAENAAKVKRPPMKRSKSKAEPAHQTLTVSNGLRFGSSSDAAAAKEKAEKAEKPTPRKRATRVRQKNDPKFIAAARELRDRYLEEVNTVGGRLLPAANGKYDVSRQLAPPSAPSVVARAAMKVERLPGAGANLLEAA